MVSLVRFSAETLHLLGDVHGRWSRALQALRAAGVCDAEGRWCAPRGTVLLQVGDLVDHGGGAPPEPLPLSVEEQERRVVDPRAPDRSLPLLQLCGGAPRGWTSALLESERRALRGAQETRRVLEGLRALQSQADAGGGQVIALLGNHDVDLLRGRFRYAAREKAYLLALLGVAPAEVAAHQSAGLDLSSAGPALTWLSALPLLATDGRLLAVHGGPPRRLSEEILASLSDLEALGAALDAARARGWDDPLFAEGSSLLSPDAREDDAVADPGLARALLRLAAADVLALGHSPFLHLPKRAWVQADAPDTRPGIESPARLGPGGAVLKLDTNLKRGGPAWVVTRGADGFRATSEAGEVRALPAPPAEEAPAEAPPAEGVDPAEHRAVERALTALAAKDPEAAAPLRAARNRLLALGAPDLAWVRAALRGGDPARLEAQLAAATARRDALAAELAPRLTGDDPVVWTPTPDQLRVAGRDLHLAPAAARAARGAIPGAPPVVTAVCFARDGRPHARFVRVDGGPPREATRRLTGWPPAFDELARLGAEVARELGAPIAAPRGAEPEPGAGAPTASAPPPALSPDLRSAAQAWAAAADLEAPPDAGSRAGRCRVGRWTLQRLPDGALVPLDTTLVDPARTLPVLEASGAVAPNHAAWLLGRIGATPRLFAAVSHELLALLRLEEFEALGQPGPVWRAGRFLFCGLDPAACAPFRAFKPHLLEFALAPHELEDALAAGLLTINLFAASGGLAIADGRWGDVDVAPEVVALGDAGVEWLWRRRATPAR